MWDALIYLPDVAEFTLGLLWMAKAGVCGGMLLAMYWIADSMLPEHTEKYELLDRQFAEQEKAERKANQWKTPVKSAWEDAYAFLQEHQQDKRKTLPDACTRVCGPWPNEKLDYTPPSEWTDLLSPLEMARKVKLQAAAAYIQAQRLMDKHSWIDNDTAYDTLFSVPRPVHRAALFG